ncbi:MAG: outer membrane beta-barrel protein [Deltaproteobacteria bacterium]|nr:outer membrane beta-barrel protein [Deltaproteobacteria bacterium]
MVTTPLLLLLQVAHAQDPTVRVGGFVEGYYAWNLNQPTNHVTALRGFDDRHNSLTLSLASAHVAVVDDVARGTIALQTGTVPAALFATEPTGAGAFAATGARELSVVREAWGGATLARGVTLDAGVFLSPVGFDGAAAKDNRFWSLSNLGVGLPFYLTGVRVAAPLGENTTLTGGVFNGWNRIFDDNEGKTVGLWVDHQLPEGARLHALYIGGAEGAGDRPWRHTVDLWADLPVGPASLLIAGTAGQERREGGPARFAAAQLAVNVPVTESWGVGARGDVFYEVGSDDALGAIFWPTSLLGEVTVGATHQLAPGVIVRLEARHDRALDPVFFADDPVSPTETQQTTFTLGLSSSFEAIARQALSEPQ